MEKNVLVAYYGTPINIEFAQEIDNQLEVGRVLLSKTGKELAAICGSRPVPGFLV